jgi:hypothetical protein
LLVLAEIISSNLKMEAICSSETSAATQQTIRRHISEDDTLYNHRCENLKSYRETICLQIHLPAELAPATIAGSGASVYLAEISRSVITILFCIAILVQQQVSLLSFDEC